MEHRFYTLDVFTNNRFEGNPLAVFTDGDELSDDQMLAIAREMNLSETVFVQKPTEEEALARLRIFTFPRRMAGFTSCKRPEQASCRWKFVSRTAARSASP